MLYPDFSEKILGLQEVTNTKRIFSILWTWTMHKKPERSLETGYTG